MSQVTQANVRAEPPGGCLRGITEKRWLHLCRECHRRVTDERDIWEVQARCRPSISPLSRPLFPCTDPGETGLPRVSVSWCEAECDQLAWGTLTQEESEVREVRRKPQEVVTLEKCCLGLR